MKKYDAERVRIYSIDNSFLAIEELALMSHDGAESYVRHVVRHPGGAAVVPIIDRQAVCVEQYRPAISRITVEIPAGKRNPGESSLQVARRELVEEVGIVTEELAWLCRINAAPCMSDWSADVFISEEFQWATKPQLADELPTDVRLVDLDNVEMMVERGELVDSKTIVGLLMARTRLDTHSM
ncbi:NUDIX hydrolase [Amycolatopsis thailandensis]|uniref:NUDIX hydrolase n=1 Tax=Amycolatopsis thailandensis TaxID=589330 RepID=UPI00363C690A